ncbi:hypothetical protein Micbo1qcDRAFT_160285, partial [Microdochium bolleyi]
MSKRSMPSDEENGRTDDTALQDTPLLAHHALDEEQIFMRATDHRHYARGRIILRNLPAFDDTALFGITVEDEDTNLREEIRKLVCFASRVEEPELFDSFGALDVTSATGFSELSQVIFQISSALNIIRHDYATLAISHYMKKDFYTVLVDTRVRLRARFLDCPTGTTGNRPETLTDERRNMLAYHALLDYL